WMEDQALDGLTGQVVVDDAYYGPIISLVNHPMGCTRAAPNMRMRAPLPRRDGPVDGRRIESRDPGGEDQPAHGRLPMGRPHGMTPIVQLGALDLWFPHSAFRRRPAPDRPCQLYAEMSSRIARRPVARRVSPGATIAQGAPPWH